MSNTTLSPRPQDDYFTYINGAWLAENPIPASENTWGTFYELRDRSWAAVHAIIKELEIKTDTSPSHDEQLLKKFFAAAFAYETNSNQQRATLQEELRKIAAIDRTDQLAQYLGDSERSGFNHFFSTFVELDDHDSSRQVLRLHQAGLTLPNRDYYLNDDAAMQMIRTQYSEYFTRVHMAFPDDIATSSWQTIMDIETDIARASWTDIALRDVEKSYNFYTLNNLRIHFAGFDWDNYFDSIGWSKPSDHIVVNQPDFFLAVIKLMQDRPLKEIKTYLTWRVINACLPYLDQNANQLSFGFFEVILNGTKEQKPLWKQAVLQADHLIISEALGKEYARRHFPDSSKNQVLAMVEDIRASYHRRIDHLQWMTAPTKLRAHAKLDAIKVFIGYPSKWKDLSNLDFMKDNYLLNVLRARRFEHELDMLKIGSPPADEQWEMSAHTVNAYHHPNRLEIVFPAAILQPPFFDPSASYATNLGGIGAVIGHEFTHGFDDQGAGFDEQGNVVQWQTDEERVSFDHLAEHIVTQADRFETVPGVYLQGKLILGEAIADIGGLELALEALHIQKYTHDDELNLLKSFARSECGHTTDQFAIKLAKTDPHPPSKFRVNAVVGNVDSFYAVYDVTPKDKLYIAPDKRAYIW